MLGEAFAKMPNITSAADGSIEQSANEPSLSRNSATLMPSPRQSNKILEENVIAASNNDNGALEEGDMALGS